MLKLDEIQPLMWYDSADVQPFSNSYLPGGKNFVNIYTPNDKLIPFQIKEVVLGFVLSVNNLYLVNYTTGEEEDILGK
ncbi:unnamed protein product, partial [marine sediment metagenome]